ncbi:MAG: hypothetical protein ATN34_02550 [Epulopiscium sp. Nele67-Bin002]|nr:MAG: hypothetical protein ATN34_02550 [Epulopiscium sp. Nele67-Bin002]
MRLYLNTKVGYENFKEIVNTKLYVDKSMIIEVLNDRINTDGKWLCVTRPRRFGKSQITFLLESYYSKAVDAKRIFDKLAISTVDNYKQHLNKHNVIKIDFSNVSETHKTYEQYIGRIINFLTKDLCNLYSTIDFSDYESVADKLAIINQLTEDKFIFIFDEWDYIFNKGLYTSSHDDFLDFLRNLLKGKSYVALCYMTGILPIKKHSSGSALNMFEEYTLLDDGIFEPYFGFTTAEVIKLCELFNMDYKELEYWYNGYKTEDGLKLFNPRSVNLAIKKKRCKSYWVNTGAMNEVLAYLEIDPSGVRDDILKMVNGDEIEIFNIEEFRAGQPLPQNKAEIYSAMVTLGFLTYSDAMLSIPNMELWQEFDKALKDKCFGRTAEI